MCQQAVEKSFKALILRHGINILKVRDLIFLAKKLNLPSDLLNKCDRLSKVYIETRYPELPGKPPFKKFNVSRTKDHIEIAGELLYQKN